MDEILQVPVVVHRFGVLKGFAVRRLVRHLLLAGVLANFRETEIFLVLFGAGFTCLGRGMLDRAPVTRAVRRLDMGVRPVPRFLGLARVSAELPP